MATIAPINDDHAITNVVFTLVLDEFIEQHVLAAAAAASPWRDTLPGTTRLPDAQVSMGGQTIEIPAMQAAIVRPDGRPIWALRFNGTELVVECTAYTRWDAVWHQAEGYLREAWAILHEHQPTAQITEYRLSVTDVFTSENAYQLDEIFDRAAPTIPPGLFDAGTIWHANVGQVEVVETGRVFETLQAQSTGKREGYEAAGPYRITLQHALRSSVDQTPHTDLEQMDALIRDLHFRNKRMLMATLRSDIRDRIGLK